MFTTPPWTVETCAASGPGDLYQIERASYWDGTTHNIYRSPPGQERGLVAIAKHEQSGLDARAGLMTGFELNIAWHVSFLAPPPHSHFLLAAGQQFFDHDLLANFGASNWQVERFTKRNDSWPTGVEPLPGSVVAFTSALYDLEVGSARRRRTGHHR
mmetsp:Transcript_93733/g.301696  ORF Transcript_93733/g.301696 Transcript_93733/m.301696 type:complete len:157 (+) Transcript_93733:111-581(+)